MDEIAPGFITLLIPRQPLSRDFSVSCNGSNLRAASCENQSCKQEMLYNGSGGLLLRSTELPLASGCCCIEATPFFTPVAKE